MPEPERKAPEVILSSRTGQPLVRVGSKRKGGTPPRPAVRSPAPELLPEAGVPLDLTTAGDDVPPEEPDPTQRDRPSIGRIEVTDAGRALLDNPDPEVDPEPEPLPTPDFVDVGAEPRTFDDLMGMFPIGDESGLYYIFVERKAPRAHSGYATQGVLRKIRERITLEDFRESYGGGDYLLTVYGPPKRRGVVDPRTHLPAPKALTKPVRFTIPWSGAGGYPPNPDAAYETEEQAMENSSGLPGYLPNLMTRGTPAGAKMLETQLSHEERRENRRIAERREAREKRDREQATAMEIVARQAEQRDREHKEQLRELLAENRQLKSDQNKGTDFQGLAGVLATMNPRAAKGEVEALTDGHRREVETLERRHREEVDGLHRRHNEEMTRVRADARADVQRTEERVTGIEQRAANRVKDVEERLEAAQIRARDDRDQALALLKGEHQRELEHVRGEASRNLEVQRIAHETLITTERHSYERELRVRAEIAESKLAGEKARLEAEVKRLETDAKKRERDVEEFKRLAEQNKDLGRLIAEAEKTARLLGLERREGGEDGGAAEPMDWKQMLMTAGVEAMKKLPDIIAQAGNSLAAVRSATQGAGAQQQMLPPGVPEPQQMQGYPAPRMQRRVFVAEGSGLEPGDPPPFFGEGQPMGGMRPQPFAPEPEQAQQPMPVGDMVQPMQQAMAQAAPQQAAPALTAHPPSMPPAQSPSMAPPPAAPPAGIAPGKADHELGSPEMDGFVLQGKDELERHFRLRTPADVFVKALVEQHGIGNVRAFQPMAGADVVIGAFTRGGFGGSRLMSYKGKRFLRSIEEALARTLAEAAPS